MNTKIFFISLFSLCFAFLTSSCKRNFQYSVLEVNPLTHALNEKAIKKIQPLGKDTFSFLLISDTQVAYDELEDFVDYSNQKYGSDEISFILHGGDFTDYGANFEYNIYYDDIKKSKFPVVGTIGNHDMLSNGRKIYNEYFGPENFSFSFGNNRFIVFNTNSREVGFNRLLPDLKWLKSEMDNTQENNIYFLSHVAPLSTDFDNELKLEFIELLASSSKTRLSINGHSHSYEFHQPFNDGVNYLVVPTLQKREYVRIDVKGNNFTVEHLTY